MICYSSFESFLRNNLRVPPYLYLAKKTSHICLVFAPQYKSSFHRSDLSDPTSGHPLPLWPDTQCTVYPAPPNQLPKLAIPNHYYLWQRPVTSCKTFLAMTLPCFYYRYSKQPIYLCGRWVNVFSITTFMSKTYQVQLPCTTCLQSTLCARNYQ